jgi:hypothetical protein
VSVFRQETIFEIFEAAAGWKVSGNSMKVHQISENQLVFFPQKKSKFQAVLETLETQAGASQEEALGWPLRRFQQMGVPMIEKL